MAIKISNNTIIDDNRNIVDAGIATAILFDGYIDGDDKTYTTNTTLNNNKTNISLEGDIVISAGTTFTVQSGTTVISNPYDFENSTIQDLTVVDSVVVGLSSNFFVEKIGIGSITSASSTITGIETNGIRLGVGIREIPYVIGSGVTVTAIGVSQVSINPASINTSALTDVSFYFGEFGKEQYGVLIDSEDDTVYAEKFKIVDSEFNQNIASLDKNGLFLPPDSAIQFRSQEFLTDVTDISQSHASIVGYDGGLNFVGGGPGVSTSIMRIDGNGRIYIANQESLLASVDANSPLQVRKASGDTRIIVRCDNLGDENESEFTAVGLITGTAQRIARLGVYKHSGITNCCAYIEMEQEDGGNQYSWFDNANLLRTSTTKTNVGLAAGTVVGDQTSDERLKNIIGISTYGLNEIIQINPIRYTWKMNLDSLEEIGLSAQELMEVIPEAVYDSGDLRVDCGIGVTSETKKLVYRPSAVIAVLINSIKELATKNNTLEQRIIALEQTVGINT